MQLYGVHEVRVLPRDKSRGVVAGYFTTRESALVAVDNEPDYKAAYITLNPLRLPEGFAQPLDPASLYHTGGTAEDSDIERRKLLLVDFDPPREAYTNSTDEEKSAAYVQALQARDYLRALNWPEPTWADSGNGFHLLYGLDLPNDPASASLVKGVLLHLKQLFPMVDSTNHNASRVCKLYGSMARKGENTAERPWRRSEVLSESSLATVAPSLLHDLALEYLVPITTPKADDENLSVLLGFLTHYNVALRSEARRITGGWQIEVECPWIDEHGDEGKRDTVCSTIGGKLGFSCLHGHCGERKWKEFRAELEKRHTGEPFSFAGPSATIGKTKTPVVVDWHTHWHTYDQIVNAPKPTFLIHDFLQRESITAIAAPVGQRKSIIALNVAYALCSKEPLFDRFGVNEDSPVSRVLYLCPEMALMSFGNRVVGIGLAPYAKNGTFLCRTMSPVDPANKDERELKLCDLQPEEVENAVVIIDTAVRFIDGDENSSTDMRLFSKTIFSLVKMKAAAVVVLFHSSKGSKESNEVTLENVMRGSGELGAFVTCCWGTKLQDQTPGAEYTSRSYLRNCKPRDFDTKPFEVVAKEPYSLFKLCFVPNDGKVTLTRNQGGLKADADGKDEARKALIGENILLTVDELEKLLKDSGMPRGQTWIKATRKKIRAERALKVG